MQRYGAGPDKTGTEQQLVAVEIVDAVGPRAEVVVVLARGRRVEATKGFDVKTLTAGPGGTGSLLMESGLYTPERYMTRGRFSKKRFHEECIHEYAETFPIVGGDFS